MLLSELCQWYADDIIWRRGLVVMDFDCYTGDHGSIPTHADSLGKWMNLRPGQPMPCEGYWVISPRCWRDIDLHSIVSIIDSQPHAIQPYTHTHTHTRFPNGLPPSTYFISFPKVRLSSPLVKRYWWVEHFKSIEYSMREKKQKNKMKIFYFQSTLFGKKNFMSWESPILANLENGQFFGNFSIIWLHMRYLSNTKVRVTHVILV